MEINVVDKKAGLGGYFVANYPPFSYWSGSAVDEVYSRFESPGDPSQSLGLYVHIPFCRRRCDFCYFRVYTKKNSSEIDEYIQGLIAELEIYTRQPYLADRKAAFVYFGGGTPSYLSTGQIRKLSDAMKRLMSWEEVKEVTFECEPGTLSEKKLAVLRELGVTRLSLGVESFDDVILEANGRAHSLRHIQQAFDWARVADFPQINIDLISGMVGETDKTWHANIKKALELSPDSVTIYQLEVPANTFLHKRMRECGMSASAIADWPTKRRWVGEAFGMLRDAGYLSSSAYTMVNKRGQTDFIYRDQLWHGSDLMGLGVSSFGHLGGINAQNESDMTSYVRRVSAGELPISRAYALAADERFIRELILQLKTGAINRAYFRNKFDQDPVQRFGETFLQLCHEGALEINDEDIVLSDHGVLRVDEFVRRFFLDRHICRELAGPPAASTRPG